MRGAAHAGMEPSFPEDAVGVGAGTSRGRRHSTALPRPGATRAGFVYSVSVVMAQIMLSIYLATDGMVF